MVNLDSITNWNNKKRWYIPDHPYRILIIDASGSGKINALINLINEQDCVDKNYLYAQDLNEYEVLIKKRKDAGMHLHLNALIECFNTMDDIMANKKFQTIINELLIRCGKLNILLALAYILSKNCRFHVLRND